MPSTEEQYAKAAAKARRLKKKLNLQKLKTEHRALLAGLRDLQADLMDSSVFGAGEISTDEMQKRLNEILAAASKK